MVQGLTKEADELASEVDCEQSLFCSKIPAGGAARKRVRYSSREQRGRESERTSEAETKHKMDLSMKSNAMRSKSREKRKEIENEEKNIDGLQKKLKLM